MIVTDPIPIIRPDIPYHEVEHDVRQVLASGMLASGRYVTDFENAAFVVFVALLSRLS